VKGKWKQKDISSDEGNSTVYCMVLLPMGIELEEYRRVGLAEIWRLDIFQGVPEKEIIIASSDCSMGICFGKLEG
jgi:hypothetical protein